MGYPVEIKFYFTLLYFTLPLFGNDPFNTFLSERFSGVACLQSSPISLVASQIGRTVLVTDNREHISDPNGAYHTAATKSAVTSALDILVSQKP